jgi:hypothetical protein
VKSKANEKWKWTEEEKSIILNSDIVIVGLQEFVPLGPKEVIREKNNKRS